MHRRSEERFEVLAGRMTMDVAGRRRVLVAGDRATVPAGAPHRWSNDGGDDLRFFLEMDPPLRFEQTLETIFGLARDGKVDVDGRPQLLQLAVFARYLEDEASVTSPPLWLQRIVFRPLAALGRALGMRPVYARYSGRMA